MKRILIVNDIPGAGKVAANINIPILAAAGHEFAILPTVILSTQTGGYYQNIVRHELEDSFQEMLDHWRENQIDFDGYLAGYFSTKEQVHQFAQYVDQLHPNQKLVILDPIMGDNGDYYDGFDHTVANALKDLIQHSVIIMPNLTEACLLADVPYKEFMSLDELEALSDQLLSLGCQYCVITGIRFPDEDEASIGFYMKDAESKGKYIKHRYYDRFYFGTGDVVISSVAAMFFKGMSLEASLEKTGKIIEEVIEQSNTMNREERFGLYFEGCLEHFTHLGGK